MIGTNTKFSTTCFTIRDARGLSCRTYSCKTKVKCSIRSCVSCNVKDTSVVVMKNKNTDVSNTPALNNIVCRNCDWRNGGENNNGAFSSVTRVGKGRRLLLLLGKLNYLLCSRIVYIAGRFIMIVCFPSLDPSYQWASWAPQSQRQVFSRLRIVKMVLQNTVHPTYSQTHIESIYCEVYSFQEASIKSPWLESRKESRLVAKDTTSSFLP